MGLDAHHFDGRNGQGVSVALLFQEKAQVGAVAVDGISYDPADGHAGGLGTLDHLLGQFGFGAKADRGRNVGGLPARQISAPVFGQIQFAVDESVALFCDVGEKDADLTVFHTPGAPAILGGDTSGVAAAFGKAAFVNDEHRPERFV